MPKPQLAERPPRNDNLEHDGNGHTQQEVGVNVHMEQKSKCYVYAHNEADDNVSERFS